MIVVALLTLVGLVFLLRAVMNDNLTPEQRVASREQEDCVYCHGSTKYTYEDGHTGPCPLHGCGNTGRRIID